MSCMRVCMQGSEFHVPGQNFSAQPGGQVGGGGNSVGIPSTRGGITFGGLQSSNHTGSIIHSGSSTCHPQKHLRVNIQPQIVQGSSSTINHSHNSSSSEMGKQTHLQPQSSVQQMYIQNTNRPASQNYFSSGPRPQPRNLNHRNTQSGNQNQVVGISGIGTSAQPPTIYPHPSLALQPSTMFVQNQVSNIHTNPHQQNVYPMNNQLPMQYSGQPQRHQAHQSQYQYPSYQTHALLAPSNIFGYAPGTQHTSYFYHQSPNTQINLNRSTASTPSNTSQHVSATLPSNQGTAIVSAPTLQQQPQQPQTIHPIDVYPGFNGSVSNATNRFKKPRSKALIDIVDPNTGKNISAEIYKEDPSSFTDVSINRNSPQSVTCSAEFVVADFAARVAKLASESEAQVTKSETENNLIESASEVPDVINKIVKKIDVKPQSSTHCSTITNTEEIETPILNLSLAEKPQLTNSEKEITVDLGSECIENLEINTSTDILQKNEFLSFPSNEDTLHKLNVVHEEMPSFNEQNINHNIESTFGEKLKVGPTESVIAKARMEKNEESVEKTNVELVRNTSKSSVECVNEQERSLQSVLSTKCEIEMCTESQQNLSEGKIMQKQKPKNKVKNKELNRKGAEKEGTDMDAFVNSANVSTLPAELVVEDINTKKVDCKKELIESRKDIKEKDNYESREKRKDMSKTAQHPVEKNILGLNSDAAYVVTEVSISENTKHINEVETVVNNISTHIDTVDHISIHSNKIIDEHISTVVAQKNQDNFDTSKFSSKSEDSKINSSFNSIASSTMPPLKYVYLDDQWSPVNTKGKKIYNREFLMKLQNDPNSKIKPLNLPDLDVVLKDSSKNRSTTEIRFKDISRHDSLFPGFVKSPLTPKTPSLNKKNHSKPKLMKSNVIHLSLSLREEVKLRETDKPWKPKRLEHGSLTEEQSKTEALYKRVRSVLNKLTPQKFETLVNQVRELQIDTQERLQGVINLVFEKAVDEPNFSVAYALMCKELSNMVVTGADSEDSSSTNFRKLILTRCQTEFEKNTADENARYEKLKDIEECSDPERKKELQINFDEEERRFRLKSVGNIRFIGELFKQNMLTSKIMIQCIRHLLKQVDEENLECLCKLLTTIGKVLESKGNDLSDYFKQMHQISNRKGKISSRIRFMLQDVIDLRVNKWIPRRDDSNPKTMDQIQREAECERMEINNTSINNTRKDERINEKKRIRGSLVPSDDGGWSQPVGRTRQVYSVETAKLKNKPPSVDDMQLGSRSTYQWSKPSPKISTPNKFSFLENVTSEQEKRGSNIHLSGSRSTGPRDYGRLDFKPSFENRNSRNNSYQLPNQSCDKDSVIEGSRSQSLSSMAITKSNLNTNQQTSIHLSNDELHDYLKKFVEEYIAGEEEIEEALKVFNSIFSTNSHASFVQEIINTVLEKSEYHRNKTSQLLSQLLSHKCISLQNFKKGVGLIIESAPDLIIDIPKLWLYLAKILVHPVICNAFSFLDLRNIIQSMSPMFQSEGYAAELLAELLTELKSVKGDSWTVQEWMQSGVQWSDFVNDRLKIDQLVSEYKLDDFIPGSCEKICESATESFNIEHLHVNLLLLLKESNFDDICEWIQINVGDNIKEPRFIRILMTAILETSIEQCNDKWTFKVENFNKLNKFIQRYVDADEYLELQCLFAVQAYMVKLLHPAGLVLKIMTHFYENNVLSNEAFLTWEKDEDPAEREGKSVLLLSLKSFFIPLKEVEDVSSGDDA